MKIKREISENKKRNKCEIIVSIYHLVSALSYFCPIVAVYLLNNTSAMKKLSKKCNVYEITCFSSLHQPCEIVIYNRALSIEEIWQDEKVILDFWHLDGYKFRKVRLLKI